MRNYEACCIFRVEEDKFKAGKEAVAAVIQKLGAENLKEDDMQVRTLAYEINKTYSGHYYLFDFNMTPDNAHKIEHDVRLIPELMRIMVSRKDEIV